MALKIFATILTYGALVVLSDTGPALAQASPLSKLTGIWGQINPQGEPVTFTRNATGRVEASGLSFVAGPALVILSQGEFGSDVRVSGAGSFECYYKMLTYNTQPPEFQWIFRGGNEACPKSATFRKDPPW